MALDKHAYEFFRRNAGYVVGRNAEGAAELARAEAVATERDWEYEWEDDPTARDFYGSDDDQTDEYLTCVLTDAEGRTLACLSGIGDPSPEYRRVVEAELALEALAEEEETVKESVS